MQAARRGDLIALVTKHSDFVLGQGLRESVTVDLAIATSITREGIVKACRRLCDEQAHPLRGYSHQALVVPAVDLDAVTEAAKAHVWPGHNYWMPFSSVEECRDFLRPFRIAS